VVPLLAVNDACRCWLLLLGGGDSHLPQRAGRHVPPERNEGRWCPMISNSRPRR